jgi:hypothetical protein
MPIMVNDEKKQKPEWMMRGRVLTHFLFSSMLHDHSTST